MDDETQKNAPVNDLPPKNLSKDIDENVKGGAEPISDRKKPKPAEPISDGR